MENGEHLIPQGSQQSQSTALSPDNQTLQTPGSPLVCTITSRAASEHCFDELLFLTVNVCFEKATRFYQGGKKKTHKDSASKGKVSWKFSKSLLSKHLSIDWAHRYWPKATYEASTRSWYNPAARDSLTWRFCGVITEQRNSAQGTSFLHFLCKGTQI